MINITGGVLRGRKILTDNSQKYRPTTSFFREWIFNVLNNHIYLDEIRLLDLFGGSGAVSFEFLSRGAISATLIEKNRSTLNYIRSNSEKLGLRNITMYRRDALKFLKKELSHPLKELSYNLIFSDPPYSSDYNNEFLDILASESKNIPGNLIIIVESQKDYILKIPDIFTIINERSSGTTAVRIIGRKT